MIPSSAIQQVRNPTLAYQTSMPGFRMSKMVNFFLGAEEALAGASEE